MNVQTLHNFQVWNSVGNYYQRHAHKFYMNQRKQVVCQFWTKYLYAEKSWLSISSYSVGGRSLFASILLNNRRSKWEWDAIFEVKEILNRVTGLENISSINFRVEWIDNRFKPAINSKSWTLKCPIYNIKTWI